MSGLIRMRPAGVRALRRCRCLVRVSTCARSAWIEHREAAIRGLPKQTENVTRGIVWGQLQATFPAAAVGFGGIGNRESRRA